MSKAAKGSSSNDDPLDEIARKEQDAPTEVISINDNSIKGLDANRYATKKTVAQGMLDIALLTSNASQLKYVLQVGQRHEFYTLLVTLISISIVLQVIMGLVLLSLNLLRDCRLHDSRHHASAVFINYLTTAAAFAASAGVLALLISFLDGDDHHSGNATKKKLADWLYHASVALMTGVVFCDVIKMTFGLDPALSEADYFGNRTSSLYNLFSPSKQ